MSERVLICGDRNWMNEDAVDYLVSKFAKDTVVIHGDARGADSAAGRAAVRHGLQLEVYPAKWDVYGRSAGPIRNQQMLDEGNPTRVYAFHNNINESKGTRDMVRRAEKAGIPTEVIKDIK